MKNGQVICLLNDSFPPVIDGVANAVKNYAQVIHESSYESVVVTPAHPDEEDSTFPYPIIRYPSMDLRKATGGYMAGIPFSPEIAQRLEQKQVTLLHSHCPIISTILARELRQVINVPLVLTYHTKFDIDIANIMKSKALRAGSVHALVENINSCDEVWAVSEGAADNLHSLGYEGECIVMPNGVDLPRGRVSEDAIHAATKDYDLPAGVPVFLFVGRMMWYKGLKITADALAMLLESGADFRMVFVGSGADLAELQDYSEKIGISGKCIFPGPIYDREVLRAWYCRADLFLFPSTFDTNGLVVREAAACSLGSVLIRGSCAAEGVTDGQNGLLIEENSKSMYECLRAVMAQPVKMEAIGQHAAKELYISWEEAVSHAMERYEYVIDRYRNGGYARRKRPIDEVLNVNGSLMEDLAHLHSLRQELHKNLQEHRSELRTHFREHLK